MYARKELFLTTKILGNLIKNITKVSKQIYILYIYFKLQLLTIIIGDLRFVSFSTLKHSEKTF